MPEALEAASGTIVAFDFGTRRIGVAVGEAQTRLAHPLTDIALEESGPRFVAIAKIIAEWKPQGLVVGLPLATNGTANDLTRRAQRFARQLEGRFGLPVSLVDERYSSVEAAAGLREAGAKGARREREGTARREGKGMARRAMGVDSAAAQIILQQYFHDHAA